MSAETSESIAEEMSNLYIWQ